MLARDGEINAKLIRIFAAPGDILFPDFNAVFSSNAHIAMDREVRESLITIDRLNTHLHIALTCGGISTWKEEIFLGWY